MSRLELVWETLRLALRAIESAAPEWYKATIPAIFHEAYVERRSDWWLSKEEVEAKMEEAGRDIYWLLEQLEKGSLEEVLALPEVKTLRTVLEQQFAWEEDSGKVTVRQPPIKGKDIIQQAVNFVQHVKTLLRMHGRAAIVVPDNVLFEGGAGETVRRKLLHECDVHTLLRLPTGVFYAQGVKANVLFFDRKPASETPWTKKLWIYDLRTNSHFTLKQKPLTRADLDEFVECYHAENRRERAPTWSEEAAPGAGPEGRWRTFRYEELLARDKINLDIFWLRDESLEDSADLPEPDLLAAEIVEDLQAALEQFREIAEDLSRGIESSAG